MQDTTLTDAINGALNTSRQTIIRIDRAREVKAAITEERIQYLRKLFPRETGLAKAAQWWRAAITDADEWRAANAVRAYIPDSLNLLWIAADARQSKIGQAAFNPIRLVTA